MEDSLFKIGDLLTEERYPQGGTFIVADVEFRAAPRVWRYKIVFEWGTHWVRKKFMTRCIKIG